MPIESCRRWLAAVSALACLGAAPALPGQELPEKCRQEPVNSRCLALMERAYYSQLTGRCVSYFYDGCGPVVPFATLAECQATCEQPAAPAAGADGLRHDPVETDPRHAAVFRDIDAEVDAALANHPARGGEGFVNIYWHTKQRLLKERYGIDWRTPGELNPQVRFD